MQIIREILSDKLFMIRVFVPIWGALFFVDLVAQPFNRLLCILTPLILLVIGIVFLIKQSQVILYEKKLAIRLPEFEKERKLWLRKRLDEQPEFMTLCYECFHFDDIQLACRLHIPGRRRTIRFPEQNMKTYCLYWMVDDKPLLLKDDPRKV